METNAWYIRWRIWQKIWRGNSFTTWITRIRSTNPNKNIFFCEKHQDTNKRYPFNCLNGLSTESCHWWVDTIHLINRLSILNSNPTYLRNLNTGWLVHGLNSSRFNLTGQFRVVFLLTFPYGWAKGLTYKSHALPFIIQANPFVRLVWSLGVFILE